MRSTAHLAPAVTVFAAALLPAAAAAQDAPGLLVTTDWLDGHRSDPGVAVLHADMRRSRFEEGHLPGARFLDMSRLVWDGDQGWGAEMRGPDEVREALERAGVADGQRIVLYSENPLYAARAFVTLEVMGLEGRVSMLDGGLGGWREEGRPLTTEEADVPRGRVTLSPREDVLVPAEWVLERLDDPRTALVDARPDDEYTGDDGGMGGMTNPGHIPGARQMYWEELVESRRVPRLHEIGRLRSLFAAAGAEEGDTVVAYCMVGLRASFTYFAARLLGYETKFYDGSWRDWGTRRDYPFVTGRSAR